MKPRTMDGIKSSTLSIIPGARKNYTQMSDQELIIASQSKDQIAFEQLVKRYQRQVFSVLYQIAADWGDTSDLAQEVFIRVWRSIATLRNPCAFRPWLHQIVTNLFYDELRKHPRNMTVSIDEPINGEDGDEGISRELPDMQALPDDILQRKDLSRAIHEAIANLPEQFRTSIVLRELQGLSYEEIAEITHTKRGTVKSRIARARAKVQNMLQPYVKDCA